MKPFQNFEEFQKANAAFEKSKLPGCMSAYLHGSPKVRHERAKAIRTAQSKGLTCYDACNVCKLPKKGTHHA